MSNIKKNSFVCFLFVSLVSFCQQNHTNKTYVTYSNNSSPKHSLVVSQEKVSLIIPSRGLFPEKKVDFRSIIKNDTVYIFEREKIIPQKKGITLNKTEFVSKFTNTHFYQKSKDIIIHIENNRPYFNKTIVDSIIGNDVVYSINGDILIPKKDSIALSVVLDKKKFKSKKLKTLKGEDAVKSYGILGLNGVIEITGKYKKCK